MSDATHSVGEDEFDALPDVYAGIDFDKIDALCGHPQPATPSSEYEFDELDDATWAEIDAVEARALQNIDGTNTSPAESYVSEGLHDILERGSSAEDRPGPRERPCTPISRHHRDGKSGLSRHEGASHTPLWKVVSSPSVLSRRSQWLDLCDAPAVSCAFR
ncbi:uncharacterized protein PHACADRAFT_247028 [Phanerochaete carnosa HHB-10118-sp]|uniref:Uncharacterized protein n=1 Tax=Phanerochaete carnosa (strain HHB-10118-sp) TaxID=650164 RepID=K5XCY3_PHACS|nr:uncharacterized protein PHACADRAFT_247028 [Phanerochaete carnosa HHB-10118-sp]EKM60847.1 hypothetical protein PHACADRAFT_247028 [Phanerochaete carnosa HHB-10118-sp]